VNHPTVTRAPLSPTATLDPDPLAPDVWYPGAVRKVIVSLPPTALDHLDALYRVARRLTGRDEEAEDLVQETYTRAIAAAAQFQPGSSLRPWLFRILRNAHIDSYRRAHKNPVRGGLEDDLAIDSAVTNREPLRGDADLERIRGSVTADIESALASLTEEARTIVLLDLEGFTEAELAEALGCALGTVKSRLSRARAILRDRLRDYGG
jgi:RNA polymerase sigma-70 factor, ECF subfamily